MSTKAITRMQNRYMRYQTRHQTYMAAGKAMKASKVLLKMQKLAKKLAKKGVSVRGAVVGRVGDVPFAATGALAIGPPAARRSYTCSLDKGRIVYLTTAGALRTLGYTAAKAKKKYKTKRRRKRLTQRDRVIIAALQSNPQAAPALLAMM